MSIINSVIDKAGRFGRKTPLAPYLRTPYKWIVRNFRSPYNIEINGVTARFNTSELNFGVEKEHKRIGEILDSVQEDDVFYDIGANIGLYSCLIGSKLQDGQVVAFEPSPPAYNQLKDNVHENGLDVRMYNVALSNEQGEVKFAVHTSDSLSRQSSIVTEGKNYDENEYQIIDINSGRGEVFVKENNIPRPDVMKIDVEGAEFNVLSGFEGILSDVRILFCEIHPYNLSENGISISDIVNLLESKGFSVEYREEDSLLRAEREM